MLITDRCLPTAKCLRKLLTVFFLFCLSAGTSLAENGTLTQYSTIGALFQRMYDGAMTLGQLRAHGGFGLGTVNRLDGELVVLDGNFYQVKADGTVHLLPADTRTPFAAVTAFAPDQRHRIRHSLDYAALRENVNSWIPTGNFFYAIKVSGLFAHVRARSVSEQRKPYPPMSEVVKGQSVFEFKNTRGTMVGFRVPAYAGNLNVPGFHLHFLTSDRKGGGHVLDFQLEDATIEIDQLSQLFLILPKTETFQQLQLSPASPDSLRKVEGPN
jgi:acetolactate decarboxylase